MTKDYSMVPFNEIRRRDRAVFDEAWIKAFLHRAPYGVLATSHEHQPFINANLFVFDEGANVVYLHTADHGRTRANVEGNERACFSVSEMGRLLPAEVALEFSVEYAGVTVFGRVKVITDQEERVRALQMLLDKYFPHLKPDEDYRAITVDELARTSVFRLEIESWSGKRKVAPVDFPGAFVYPIG